MLSRSTTAAFGPIAGFKLAEPQWPHLVPARGTRASQTLDVFGGVTAITGDSAPIRFDGDDILISGQAASSYLGSLRTIRGVGAPRHAGSGDHPAMFTSLVAPTVTAVTASGAGIDAGGNGVLNAGHAVILTLHFDTGVAVSHGTPRLTLNDGATATYDAVHSTPTALAFTTTVAEGANVPNLAVSGLALDGAVIKSAHGITITAGGVSVETRMKILADLSGATAGMAGTLTIDTVAPDVPVVALATDSGASATDHVTQEAALAVGGTEDGATLRYSIDGGPASASYDPAALKDGHHTVSVTQADRAGNVSQAASVSFTLDTAAPDAGADMLTVAAQHSNGAGVTFAGTAGLLANDSDALTAFHLVGAKAGTDAAAGFLSVADGPITLHGAEGDLLLKADGTYAYTLGEGYDALGVGATAQEVFTYAVVDQAGNTATQTLIVGLTGISHTPILHSDLVGVALQGTARADAAHGVLANDSASGGHALSVTQVSFGDRTVAVEAGHAATVTGHSGTLTLAADGSYRYVATAEGAGYRVGHADLVPQDSFVYTVSDGHGHTATSTLTATVALSAAQVYLQGTDGDDTLRFTTGGTEFSKVPGAHDAMILAGGDGDDTLVGGNGADALIAGAGHTTATGGAGADTFVFNLNSGRATVTDFHHGEDVIQFAHEVFAGSASVLSHATQVGADVVIAADAAHSLTLQNTVLKSLAASDFHFA